MPYSPKKHISALLIFIISVIPAFGEWDTIVHLNQKYVDAAQIPSFYKEYKFKKEYKAANKIRYASVLKDVNIDFIIGSQEIFINNLKFHFSYPVVAKSGKTLISQIDWVKLIHPILRPSHINKGRTLKTVILDPGHGGYEPGTVNNYGQEKTYTLSLARKMKTLLEKVGFNVVMTRPGDSYPSLQQRVTIANRYEDAIFISLHFNAGGAGRADGIETFSLSPPGVAHYGRGLKSSDLQIRAGNAQDYMNIALATAVHGQAIRKLGARDRGIRRARFTVLTGIRHPAILFEGGFMSNSSEARKINDDRYLESMAHAIADGIIRYKTVTEKHSRR